MAQHLIAAADTKEALAILDGCLDLRSLAGIKITKQHFLLKILSPADKEKIELSQIRLLSDLQGRNLTIDASPFQPLLHAKNISSVAIEIQNFRI